MSICKNCGAQNHPEAKYCQTCGASLQADAGANIGYAGFWSRVAAVILDFIVLSFGSAILFGAAHIAGAIASLFLPWIYEAAMTSSKRQATIGKMALGIIVTDGKGRPITFGRATGRHFAKYLSALILGIGFIMAAFTVRKQALHDLIADTLVLARAQPPA